MKKTSLNAKDISLSHCLATGMLLFGSQAFAVTGSGQSDRLTVDWGNMTVSFYGVSEPIDNKEDFKVIERRARAEGIAAAKENIVKLYQSQMKKNNLPATEEGANRAATAVTTNPKSIRTEYFSDGHVKIYFENSLALALQPAAGEFSRRERLAIEGSMFSGLILRSDAHIAPKAAYEVVDETGQVLYSQKDVSEEAFHQNLMGRWFQKPNRQEIASAVGLKPISINFELDSKGRLQVQGSVWREAISASPAILQNARVALIAP